MAKHKDLTAWLKENFPQKLVDLENRAETLVNTNCLYLELYEVKDIKAKTFTKPMKYRLFTRFLFPRNPYDDKKNVKALLIQQTAGKELQKRETGKTDGSEYSIALFDPLTDSSIRHSILSITQTKP